MLVRTFDVAVALVSWALLGAGCGQDEQVLIAAERSRFRQLAPEQYVVAACGTEIGAPCVREVVIAGRVMTAEVADRDSAAWRPVAELGAWVDQVTRMFDAALEEASSLRLLEFEPRWHYVSEYQLGGAAGGRRVTCFLPDRVDLQRCTPRALP
ncbi:MAG TPA: hypothetical protein VNN80_31690 [Polyangiaceae bacterium]|jgi:hypothetical protein|nr:hypothetical protein [Polyangiaceae bacterium]